MRALRWVLIVLAALLVVVPGGLTAYYWIGQWRAAAAQDPLEAFYTPPDPVTGRPGDVVRSEPAPEWNVPGATAQRILYVTEGVGGVLRVAGGTVWVPDRPAPGPRRVVAWAHGTVGLGPECAPSRNPSLMPTMSAWVGQMAAKGWVVTATDYQGLGTPPPYSYLVGRAEVRDVVNSVRAARSLPGAQAGAEWAVYGFSQGGHSALWTGHLAAELAPELHLVAVAAVSPAAPLAVILDQQWDTGVAWAIGPEVMVSWPAWSPGLTAGSLVSPVGQRVTMSQALDCATAAALFGIARQEAGQRYFTQNPGDTPGWDSALRAETPGPLPGDLPVLVPIGTADDVVLASSIAYLQKQWCRAGSDLTMDWLGGVNHLKANQVAAPAVVQWLTDRFAGRRSHRNCGQAPPVAAYRPGS